jgi:predicted CoA-binding protein
MTADDAIENAPAEPGIAEPEVTEPRVAEPRIAEPRAADRRGAERTAARAWLDLHEGRGPIPVLDDAGIAELLRSARTIAVVGASPDPWRPSHDVFRSLVAAGYTCLPINPHVAEVAGVATFATLAAAAGAAGPIDIVDVFRRPEYCAEHAREAVAVGAGALWLQLGIVNWEAARIARDGGLGVVMDRCTAVEVGRLGR